MKRLIEILNWFRNIIPCVDKMFLRHSAIITPELFSSSNDVRQMPATLLFSVVKFEHILHVWQKYEVFPTILRQKFLQERNNQLKISWSSIFDMFHVFTEAPFLFLKSRPLMKIRKYISPFPALMTSYSGRFPRPPATIGDSRVHPHPSLHSGYVIFGKMTFRQFPHLACNLRLRKISGSGLVCRLWDLEKLWAPAYIYIGSGTHTNPGL